MCFQINRFTSGPPVRVTGAPRRVRTTTPVAHAKDQSTARVKRSKRFRGRKSAKQHRQAAENPEKSSPSASVIGIENGALKLLFDLKYDQEPIARTALRIHNDGKRKPRLQTQLEKSQTPERVLTITDASLDSMYPDDLGKAMLRLGVLKQRDQSYSHITGDPRFRRLLHHTRNHRLQQMSCQSLADFITGLAKASHIPDADTIQIFIEDFCKKALQHVLPQDIPRVLSALGTFGSAGFLPSMACMQALKALVKSNLLRFRPHCLCHMAHMFAHLGQLDAEFMPAIAVAAAARRKSFSPILLACTLRAFAMLQERNYMLLGAFADEACRQMRSFSPNSLVAMVASCASLGERNERLLGAAALQACRKIEIFSLVQLMDLVWAFSAVKYLDRGLVGAIHQRCLAILQELRPGMELPSLWAAKKAFASDQMPGDAMMVRASVMLAVFSDPHLARPFQVQQAPASRSQDLQMPGALQGLGATEAGIAIAYSLILIIGNSVQPETMMTEA